MGKYVLVYTGGSMAETPEAQEAAMKAWISWFGTLGSAVVEAGNPFGPSTAVTAKRDDGADPGRPQRLLGTRSRKPRAGGQAGGRLPGARCGWSGRGVRSHPDVRSQRAPFLGDFSAFRLRRRSDSSHKGTKLSSQRS